MVVYNPCLQLIYVRLIQKNIQCYFFRLFYLFVKEEDLSLSLSFLLLRLRNVCDLNLSLTASQDTFRKNI